MYSRIICFNRRLVAVLLTLSLTSTTAISPSIASSLNGARVAPVQHVTPLSLEALAVSPLFNPPIDGRFNTLRKTASELAHRANVGIKTLVVLPAASSFAKAAWQGNGPSHLPQKGMIASSAWTWAAAALHMTYISAAIWYVHKRFSALPDNTRFLSNPFHLLTTAAVMVIAVVGDWTIVGSRTATSSLIFGWLPDFLISFWLAQFSLLLLKGYEKLLRSQEPLLNPTMMVFQHYLIAGLLTFFEIVRPLQPSWLMDILRLFGQPLAIGATFDPLDVAAYWAAVPLSLAFHLAASHGWSSVWPNLHGVSSDRITPSSDKTSDQLATPMPEDQVNERTALAESATVDLPHPLLTVEITKGTALERERWRSLLEQASKIIPAWHMESLRDGEVELGKAVYKGRVVNERKIVLRTGSDTDENLLDVIIHELGHIAERHSDIKRYWYSTQPHRTSMWSQLIALADGFFTSVFWAIVGARMFMGPLQNSPGYVYEFVLIMTVIALPLAVLWGFARPQPISFLLFVAGAPFVSTYAMYNESENFAESYFFKARRDTKYRERAEKLGGVLAGEYRKMSVIFEALPPALKDATGPNGPAQPTLFPPTGLEKALQHSA
jgi:hypothetical protein